MTSKSRRDDSGRSRRQRKVPRRVSKSHRSDPRLIGTWQSDADATIAELRKARPVTDKQEEALRKLFGKMKITYTEATFTTELNGVVDTQPYQVVSRDGESVAIESWSALSKKDEQCRVRFIGSDTYWVEVEQLALNECFRRLRNARRAYSKV